MQECGGVEAPVQLQIGPSQLVKKLCVQAKSSPHCPPGKGHLLPGFMRVRARTAPLGSEIRGQAWPQLALPHNSRDCLECVLGQIWRSQAFNEC